MGTISDRLKKYHIDRKFNGGVCYFESRRRLSVGHTPPEDLSQRMLRQALENLGGTGKVAAFAAMEDMLVSDPEINYKTDGRSL